MPSLKLKKLVLWLYAYIKYYMIGTCYEWSEHKIIHYKQKS